MDDLPIPHSSLDHSGLSLRSRASSTISTGTKFSIATLPYEEQHPTGIDVLLGQRNFRISARPDSVLSISSFSQPPPYNGPSDGYGASTPLATSPTEHSSSITALSPQTPTQSEPASPNTATALDHENVLSRHYTHVVRTIDANHHAELARLSTIHTAELASTRHAIDAAYRRELKAKDVHVEQIRRESAKEVSEAEERCRRAMEEKEMRMEQLRQECASNIEATEAKRISTITDLTQECEVRIHKARNEVEDVWEWRWKDRARISEEEAVRRDDEKKVALYRHRDELWMRVLGGKWPCLIDDFQAVRRAVAEMAD